MTSLPDGRYGYVIPTGGASGFSLHQTVRKALGPIYTTIQCVTGINRPEREVVHTSASGHKLRTSGTILPLSLNALMVCLFFGSTAPSGSGFPHSRGFLITHNDAPQSVGLLWTSDQLVTETSI